MGETQPALTSKEWTDLTAEEKSAATVLGYMEKTWSTVSAPKKASWSDMTVTTVTTTQMSQQQAAALLGFTQLAWDNVTGLEVHPDLVLKPWADLTTQEKMAATVLGYTNETWS